MNFDIIIGVIVGGATVYLVMITRAIWTGKPKITGPHIPLDSPCPACGHRQCKLKYAPGSPPKVMRACETCGCVVQQDPIAADLFKK